MIYKSAHKQFPLSDEELNDKKIIQQLLNPIDYKHLPKGYFFDNRYEIINALEKGSGGTVYKVYDTLNQGDE